MKVHIVGAGVVGVTTGRIFTRFGHDVEYSDIDRRAGVFVDDADRSKFHLIRRGNVFPEADVHFICTPEDAAPSAVRRVSATKGFIVIRSSVLPGTTEALAKELDRPLWHNPEFLREATAESDFRYEPYAIIGSAYPPHIDGKGPYSTFPPYGLEIMCDAYRAMGKEIIFCSSTESEFLKLILNAYLATQISFWNDVKPLCDLMEVNSHRIAQLVAMDPRVSKYGAYLHGAAYGGRCLPKDLDHLLALRDQLAVELGSKAPSMLLLEATKAVNTSLGGK